MLGVSALNGWNEATRYALAVMFLFTSTAHFNKMRHDLARMMPTVFPKPMALVYFTGVCEILGAVGILLPQTLALAGLCLVVFLAMILPANIKAAIDGLSIGGRPATNLWLRVPMQILFVGLVLWTTRPWTLWSGHD